MKKIVGLLFISVTLFCAQSFVVQKKETVKKESRSQLKQRVCQLFYDILDGSTNVLSTLSQLQKTTLDRLSEVITTDKKNVIDTATDAELKALVEQLEGMIMQYAQLQTKAASLMACVSKK